SQIIGRPYRLTVEEDHFELSDGGAHTPVLRLRLFAARPAFTVESKTLPDILYRVEESRGYDFRGDLARGQGVTLLASTEPWDVIRALGPGAAHDAEHERRRRLIQAADPAT